MGPRLDIPNISSQALIRLDKVSYIGTLQLIITNYWCKYFIEHALFVCLSEGIYVKPFSAVIYKCS
jgi:hypothetical protein